MKSKVYILAPCKWQENSWPMDKLLKEIAWTAIMVAEFPVRPFPSWPSTPSLWWISKEKPFDAEGDCFKPLPQHQVVPSVVQGRIRTNYFGSEQTIWTILTTSQSACMESSTFDSSESGWGLIGHLSWSQFVCCGSITQLIVWIITPAIDATDYWVPVGFC